MIKLVPENKQQELSMAIAKGDFNNIKKIIEQNNIDVNSYIDNKFYDPILMKVLLSQGIKDENERIKILRYFLEKGADPNMNCKSGYNCLHVAVQQERLVKALDLFLDFNGDVNLTNLDGANIVYWAIQRFPWRKEGKERQLHLNVVEKILLLGADLDHRNNFGVTPRKWLDHSSEDLKNLVAKCEKLNPVYKPSKTLQNEFPTNLKYFEIANKIWKDLVPPIGQAETIQGELLRAIEKLRDEAQRNGNINYSDSHKKLAKFVMDVLVNSQLFNKIEITKIKSESKKLMKASQPYLDDDAYDYLTDQICIFYINKSEPIKHERNPEILC